MGCYWSQAGCSACSVLEMTLFVGVPASNKAAFQGALKWNQIMLLDNLGRGQAPGYIL